MGTRELRPLFQRDFACINIALTYSPTLRQLSYHLPPKHCSLSHSILIAPPLPSLDASRLPRHHSNPTPSLNKLSSTSTQTTSSRSTFTSPSQNRPRYLNHPQKTSSKALPAPVQPANVSVRPDYLSPIALVGSRPTHTWRHSARPMS